jgi:hypothetical protein
MGAFFEQAPGKKAATSMLHFSQLHHQTYSQPKKRNGVSINRKVAFISQRQGKFACSNCITFSQI